VPRSLSGRPAHTPIAQDDQAPRSAGHAWSAIEPGVILHRRQSVIRSHEQEARDDAAGHDDDIAGAAANACVPARVGIDLTRNDRADGQDSNPRVHGLP